jgi:hypothetical protein
MTVYDSWFAADVRPKTMYRGCAPANLVTFIDDVHPFGKEQDCLGSNVERRTGQNLMPPCSLLQVQPSGDTDEPGTQAVLQQLLEKQRRIHARCQAFSEETAENRCKVAATFAVLRAVLDSSERAALAVFDEEARRVTKQLEIEEEAVEVLSQQLSARVLACCGSPDTLSVPNESVTIPGAVDVAVCDEVLGELLKGCWSLVNACGDAGDGKTLAVAEAKGEVCDVVRCPLSRTFLVFGCCRLILTGTQQLLKACSRAKAAAVATLHSVKQRLFEATSRNNQLSVGVS